MMASEMVMRPTLTAVPSVLIVRMVVPVVWPMTASPRFVRRGRVSAQHALMGSEMGMSPTSIVAADVPDATPAPSVAVPMIV